jgi:hypothetical protein
MSAPKYLLTSLSILTLPFILAALCRGQAPAGENPDKKNKDCPRKVTVVENGNKITQLDIDLRNAPNNMEPCAEPRRIRVDDRANVRFRLNNLSPLDVCSRNANAPTPTAETNVAESFVATIAGKAPFAIGGGTANFLANSKVNEELLDANIKGLQDLEKIKPKQCSIEKDPEYKRILADSKTFFPAACGLIGTLKPREDCRVDADNQLTLSTQIDDATRAIANFAAKDFRGTSQSDFTVEGNSDLDDIRDAYGTPLSTIEAAGKLQATVDEISTWATDLHKKYDYSVSSGDGGPSNTALPPTIPGALLVAPTELSASPAALMQMVRISSGGKAASFTATTNASWLLLSKDGGKTNVTNIQDRTPDYGTFGLTVTVKPDDLGNTAHYGSITIAGTGAAKGTTVVNVTFKPAAEPDECTLTDLREIDKIVDRARAEMSILSDNNKSLASSQASLKTAYMGLVKVEDDFKRRKGNQAAKGAQDEPPIIVEKDGILYQDFNLGTDRKATSTGSFSCVSDLDGKTPTTTNMNYSLLYQDVPHWSASAGFLTSFQEKKIIGIANEIDTSTTPPTNAQFFRVTDRAQVQFIPMAFVNYRLGHYHSSHYGKNKEDELVWTGHLSGGFGVNPNTGTNQPEFFAGFATGLNRFMFHSGVHIGRTESLGGGYVLNTSVPAGLTSAPISWSYHPAFSIGFSVRLAPY